MGLGSEQLAMGALSRGEELRELAGDPRRGGTELLCAKPLHRADKYNVIEKKNTFSIILFIQYKIHAEYS